MDRYKILASLCLLAFTLVGFIAGWATCALSVDPPPPIPIYVWPTPQSDCYVVVYDEGPLLSQHKILKTDCWERILEVVAGAQGED